ncbi:hypothetical protein AB6B38_14775 (plasmid) [Glycocaulis abyssi]|uniref:Uncharacterized protein n=1 Tax=Glycocaulis abyssi TaxID=1433403 RepID=A0ABV9NFB8_9PROT
MLRDPNGARNSVTNMLPQEIDEFLGKPDPNDDRAAPFVLAGIAFIAAFAAYMFFFF